MGSKNDSALILGMIEGLRPDPILTVSEWSDKYRYLSQRASAEPGRWRTDRTPYLREVMDSLSAIDPAQTITLIKGAQLGGSEAGNNWLGYVVDYAPGPIMAVQPTVEMAKRNSKQRIDPLVAECPRLREKIKPARSRDAGNTILVKEFPGGVLVMTGANSAVGLRSLPARYLFLDEVDAYPGDVDGEGDPVSLAEARARTFARRKIFKVSTPTIDGRSRIQAAYDESDQRRYEVPCPHCGYYQEFFWKNVRWPEGNPHAAVYICADCNAEIQEHHKTKMLDQGRWVARNPERKNKKHIGFHLNSLYSPVGWFSWADAAELWEKAKKDPQKLRSFVNTVLGETWKEKGDAPEWRRLYDRREPYDFNTVPAGAVMITAGVDVQKDRLECELVAWGANKQSWSLDHRVFMGSTSEDTPWDKLFELLDETFPSEDGGRLLIRMMAIDSGYNTQEVYNQVRRCPQNRVIAVKGVDHQQTIIGSPKAVDVDARGKQIRRGVRVWAVGSSILKSELYGWLRLEKPINDVEPCPAGFCHFPEYDEEYFKSITAEQLMLRQTRNGGRKYEWEKTRERNEVLDCRVYARAAASLVGLDRFKPDQLQKLRQTPQPTQSVQRPTNSAVNIERPPTTRRPSSFW